MTTTTGRFDLTSWDEEVYDDNTADGEGAQLLTVTNTKTFEGGITGTSTTRLLQAVAQEGAAAYVAVERVTAEIGGRKGTFVFVHHAVGSAAGGSMTVGVVPHSGTGDLTGLGGELTIEMTPEREHSYSFTYSL